jgi:hypothetical protein
VYTYLAFDSFVFLFFSWYSQNACASFLEDAPSVTLPLKFVPFPRTHVFPIRLLLSLFSLVGNKSLREYLTPYLLSLGVHLFTLALLLLLAIEFASSQFIIH